MWRPQHVSACLKKTYSLGHWIESQGLDSERNPVQLRPLNSGGRFVQFLDLFWIPMPQVTVHVDQTDQSDHAVSTEDT